MKTNCITKQQVNYREDEIINKPLSCTELVCNEYQTDKDGKIDLSRSKQDTGIQYRRQQNDEVKGFIPKLVARPEYGTVYQHQGILLQNLHRYYLSIVIRLPKLKDLEQKILTFPELLANYGLWNRTTEMKIFKSQINIITISNDHTALFYFFKI